MESTGVIQRLSVMRHVNVQIFIIHLFIYCYESPQWARVSSFTRFLDHTQRRTTVDRTPLDEWSARRGHLYLTTHNNHNRQTCMSPGGIITHDLSRRAAADLRLRPRGHWGRRQPTVRLIKYINKIQSNTTQLMILWTCISYIVFSTMCFGSSYESSSGWLLFISKVKYAVSNVTVIGNYEILYNIYKKRLSKIDSTA
jgi:hypothetical protein